MSPVVLVSACLCGLACRYDGRATPVPGLEELVRNGAALPFCPETAGGLPVPRPPAEIRNNRVVTAMGEDLTEAFRLGATLALDCCRQHGIGHALLKDKSPSCGCDKVYDGSFSGRLRPGRGLTAALLADAGIAVQPESQARFLLVRLGLPREKNK